MSGAAVGLLNRAYVALLGEPAVAPTALQRHKAAMSQQTAVTPIRGMSQVLTSSAPKAAPT